MAWMIVIVCVIAAVAIGAAYFSKDRRVKRAIRKARQVSVVDVHAGAPAKVVGTLSYADDTLKAPLSGRPCAFYEVVVEEYRRGSNSSGSWREVIRESESADFFLEDASGAAMIRMKAAQVAVVKDSHSSSGTFDNATGIEEAFLRRHGRDSKGWILNKKIRYTEGVLERGERVAVYGRGTWDGEGDPDPLAPDGQGTARRLVMRGSRDVPLYVSDDTSTMR